MTRVLGNILDPIHEELSPHVWDNPASAQPTLKPQHRKWIKGAIYKALHAAGYTDVEKWLHLVLTGSLTTYQYSEASDCDISLFVDVKLLPEWSRGEMIGVMVGKVDGATLPGTPFVMQDFVVPSGIKPDDLYKPGLRSGYDLDTEKWIVPPDRDHVRDVEKEENGFYVFALQMADKMESLLKYEPDKAVAFWHQIHRRRQIDQKRGKGDFAESNIVYKFLANRNLFPAIAQVSGEYIAHGSHRDNSDKQVRTLLPLDVASQGREMKKRSQITSLKDHDDAAWDDHFVNQIEPIANVTPKEVAKFIYHPLHNRMLLGEMGKEEGEMPHHQALLQMSGWNPKEVAFGQVAKNGYGEIFARPKITGPGSQQGMNQYAQQYRTEEALRRAVPGTKFTNPIGLLNPDWELPGNPEVQYVGQPPTVEVDPDAPAPSQWEF